MHILGWEERGEAWRWRRRLWVWEEEMLAECRNFINGFIVQSDIHDRWQWDPDIVGGYIVRGVY